MTAIYSVSTYPTNMRSWPPVLWQNTAYTLKQARLNLLYSFKEVVPHPFLNGLALLISHPISDDVTKSRWLACCTV